MTNTPEEKAEWEKRFDEKWKRMRKNGFGGHSSIDDRMIWNVDTEDEDGWVFADETIKTFIRHVLSAAEERGRKKGVEEAIRAIPGEVDDKYFNELKGYNVGCCGGEDAEGFNLCRKDTLSALNALLD